MAITPVSVSGVPSWNSGFSASRHTLANTHERSTVELFLIAARQRQSCADSIVELLANPGKSISALAWGNVGTDIFSGLASCWFDVIDMPTTNQSSIVELAPTRILFSFYCLTCTTTNSSSWRHHASSCGAIISSTLELLVSRAGAKDLIG